MTDAEVDDYVRYLQAHLPPAHSHLSAEQVRVVLDAESAYYEHRFGPVRGWRRLLRVLLWRSDPSPATVEAALPEFEAFALQALAVRDDLSPADIRAVMRVEGEFGPHWIPPQREEKTDER